MLCTCCAHYPGWSLNNALYSSAGARRGDRFMMFGRQPDVRALAATDLSARLPAPVYTQSHVTTCEVILACDAEAAIPGYRSSRRPGIAPFHRAPGNATVGTPSFITKDSGTQLEVVS